MSIHAVHRSHLALAALLLFGGSVIPAAAQVLTQVCENQQSLEQLLETEGSLVADDCRAVTITRLEREAGDLCVIDFSDSESGIVDQLLAATRAQQWWIACESLAEGVVAQ